MKELNIFTPYKRFESRKPLIFLAGPIMGAEDWHDQAIEIIRKINKEVAIASPKQNKYDEGSFSLEEQTDWESYHLKKASDQGSALFWLAKEKEHYCHRAYAQTTRFELGEWSAKQIGRPLFLAVGIEEGFTNGEYIKKRITQDNRRVNICNTLEETCTLALQIINSRRV